MSRRFTNRTPATPPKAVLREHGDCTAIPGDLGRVNGCEALAAEIAERESKLDLLVNNAGLTWSTPIDDFTEKAWDKIGDLDVKSPFFLTQKLLPLLRAAARPERRAAHQRQRNRARALQVEDDRAALRLPGGRGACPE